MRSSKTAAALVGALLALGARSAHGYAGYEARASCQIGFGQASDSTSELDTASASLEAGIAGQGSFGDCTSETDAASGSLAAAVVLSQADGAVSGRTPTRGASRILERIYLTIPTGGTATVTASIAGSRSLAIEGGGTGVAGATLDLNGCRVVNLVRAGGEEVLNQCNLAGAEADPSSLSMTLQIPRAWVQPAPNNFIELSAQIEAEVSTLEGTSTGSAAANGALSVAVEGVTSWRFSNPSSLTVPEPSAFGAALAALGALASLRRH